MPNLIIPQFTDGKGNSVRAVATIKLVDTNDPATAVERVGFDVSTGVAIRPRTVRVPKDSPISVELTAQANISLDEELALSYYEVLIQVKDVEEKYYVQMPAVPGDYTLQELIGLAQIAPGSLLAGRLLPDDATDGQGVLFDDVNGWYAATLPTLTDGDKGDIVISGDGTVWTIEVAVVQAIVAAMQTAGDLPPPPGTLAEGDMITVNALNKYAKVEIAP